jgi:hypothetical protein
MPCLSDEEKQEDKAGKKQRVHRWGPQRSDSRSIMKSHPQEKAVMGRGRKVSEGQRSEARRCWSAPSLVEAMGWMAKVN